MMKIISAATLMAFTATASFAGALNEAEKDDTIEFVPAASSSVGAPLIIGAVVGTALVVGLVSGSNDNDGGSVDGHGDED